MAKHLESVAHRATVRHFGIRFAQGANYLEAPVNPKNPRIGPLVLRHKDARFNQSANTFSIPVLQTRKPP